VADDLPTIESLLGQVRARGLRVNNLFQRTDGLWQANLRQDGAERAFFGFGYGPDPQGALIVALSKAVAGAGVPATKFTDDDLDPAKTGAQRTDAVLPIDDEDLIG
jgi:hypothetical protein